MPETGLDLPEAARMIRTGRAAEALPRLEAAVRGAVSLLVSHTVRIEALISLGRKREAMDALMAAIALKAPSADGLDALAFFARQLDAHDLSNALYRQVTELAPHDATYWYNLATSERALGRLVEARNACERALERDPALRSAVLLRSEVRRATSDDNNVSDLKARIARRPDVPDTMFLSYALGKELHELNRYDEAFGAFREGADARRKSLKYDVADDERKLRRIAEVFAEPGEAAGSTHGRNVFVIGLPRSGTTLTERILGGLPSVRSNGETNNFSTALLRATPAQGEDIFERTARADYAGVAQTYDALAAPQGGDSKVIEKLPFNYLYVGAIMRAFPNSPVIWLRRAPLDSCFAMYRTLFGAAYPFSYDFEDLARYYAAYEALMVHWATIYPAKILQVNYEDLVEDPDTAGRRLAEHCGVGWNQSALDIANNRTASLTASAAQVRGGIYGSSAGLWRNYRRHLEPLVNQLRQRGVVVNIE